MNSQRTPDAGDEGSLQEKEQRGEKKQNKPKLSRPAAHNSAAKKHATQNRNI